MILLHARACLRVALGRPLTLLLVVGSLGVLVPVLGLMVTMPALLQVLVLAATGSLADGLLRGVLVPHDRGIGVEPQAATMPTLPLSRRARAMGEALAAAPLLVAGSALASLLPDRFLEVEGLHVGVGLPAYALVVPLLVLPAVVGASLQVDRGAPAQLLAMGLPGAVLALAWQRGLLAAAPLPPALTLGALSLATGGLLLALGPLPRLSVPDLVAPLSSPALSSRALSRPPRSPADALASDLARGLLRAHLRASPMVLVAGIPWALTRDSADLGPEFPAAVAVAAVSLAAAFLPLGRNPLGTGGGQLSPWLSLPLDRHTLARRLYAHALACLLGLPVAFVAGLVALGRLESFAVPVLAVLGLTLAPTIAAALLSWWLAGWRRVALAGLLGLGLFLLAVQALAAQSAWALVGLGLASLVAGLVPVADLLRPWRLAPAVAGGRGATLASR